MSFIIGMRTLPDSTLVSPQLDIGKNRPLLGLGLSSDEVVTFHFIDAVAAGRAVRLNPFDSFFNAHALNMVHLIIYVNSKHFC